MRKKKLNELLEGIIESNLHPEIMTGANVGKEITVEEYQRACKRLEEIIDLVDNDTPKNDPTFQELDKISQVIEAYELEHYPIGEPTLEHKGLEGTVRWGSDCKGYYGKAMSDGDLICYEGDTLELLEKAFKEAVDLYLEEFPQKTRM